MGGCVSSFMDYRNEMSVCEHEAITRARRYHASGAWNVCVSPPENDSETGIYVAEAVSKQDIQALQKSQYEGTLIHKLHDACRQYGDRPAFGYRPLERIEKTTVKDANGREKKWEYYHYAPTVSHSFSEFWEMIVGIGQGFKTVGVKPGDRVGIYEDTRWEWMVTCYGLWTIGAVGVTVYANLGQDALAYAIKEAELNYIVCNGSLAQNIVTICTDSKITVPIFLHLGPLKGDLRAHDWHDLLKQGRDIVRRDNPKLPEINYDDLALIMYTSGTTGDPKGVMMRHGNMCSAVTQLRKRLAQFSDEDLKSECYLAYLPLAHVLEFAAESVCMQRGVYLGYGTPRTLTDTAAKPHGDLTEYKPFFFISVPRIFDTIKKTIESRVPEGLKRRIFRQAYAARLRYLKEGKNTPFYNDKVFGNIRKVLGGNCYAMLSGGAPLSGMTQEFITVCADCTLIQGYGLTETCCATAVQMPWDLSTETLGVMLEGVEVKLRAAHDWKPTNNPPQGEILVRGPGVSPGYYKQPERTAETFLPGGWFATGDVGELTPGTNNLRIIGRVKALAKTAHGEYVPLETIEVIAVLNPICLPNGVCAIVKGEYAHVAALVLTDEEKAMRFARENNIPGAWPLILESREFNEAAGKSIYETLRANGRKPFECISRVRMLNDEWTPENGLMTATQKVRRRELEIKYADQIKELFESGPADVASLR